MEAKVTSESLPKLKAVETVEGTQNGRGRVEAATHSQVGRLIIIRLKVQFLPIVPIITPCL